MAAGGFSGPVVILATGCDRSTSRHSRAKACGTRDLGNSAGTQTSIFAMTLSVIAKSRFPCC
jgi:hypothetical protein